MRRTQDANPQTVEHVLFSDYLEVYQKTGAMRIADDLFLEANREIAVIFSADAVSQGVAQRLNCCAHRDFRNNDSLLVIEDELEIAELRPIDSRGVYLRDNSIPECEPQAA
jgi:hypothetical protein